jgi:hypothetical protein
VLIGPPFIISEDEIALLARLLRGAIEEATDSIAARIG